MSPMSTEYGQRDQEFRGADVHGSQADPQLLHHRPHRPRQVDPGGPDPADVRRGRGARHARPVPGQHGHRARARHHHQGAERAAAVGAEVGCACRRGDRAASDRHPRPRGLHLRGLARAGGVRGRDSAGRRGAGHRGADAGEPVPGHGERSGDYSGPEQDRPAGRRPGEVLGGDRAHHRLRARGRAAGVGQDGRGRRGADGPRVRARAAAGGRCRCAGARDDLRLGLRHLPRRGHLHPRRRWPPGAA